MNQPLRDELVAMDAEDQRFRQNLLDWDADLIGERRRFSTRGRAMRGREHCNCMGGHSCPPRRSGTETYLAAVADCAFLLRKHSRQ